MAHVSVSPFTLLSCSLLSHDLEFSFQVSEKEWRRYTWFSTCAVKTIVSGRILTFETEKPNVGLFILLFCCDGFSVK